MTPGRERQARLRQQRVRRGERQVTVWLDRDSLARLAALRQRGERDSTVVRRALQALAAEHNRAVEAQICDLEARAIALHARVRAMFYEDGLKERQIANQLNAEGEPVGVAGGRWTPSIVTAYLIPYQGGNDWGLFFPHLKRVP